MKFWVFVHGHTLITCSRSIDGSDDTSLRVCLRACAAFCGLKLKVHTARLVLLSVFQAVLLPQFVLPIRPVVLRQSECRIILQCQNSGC